MYVTDIVDVKQHKINAQQCCGCVRQRVLYKKVKVYTIIWLVACMFVHVFQSHQFHIICVHLWPSSTQVSTICSCCTLEYEYAGRYHGMAPLYSVTYATHSNVAYLFTCWEPNLVRWALQYTDQETVAVHQGNFLKSWTKYVLATRSML